MKRLTAIIVIAVASTLGCSNDAETESMTSRSLALADSVDALVDSLNHHASDILVAEGWTDLLALEKRHYEASEIHLDTVRFWIEEIEDCSDLDGQIPDTSELQALRQDARQIAIAHQLSVLWDEDIQSGMNAEELGYQIAMTQSMGELRALPLNEDVTESYSCPMFEF